MEISFNYGEQINTIIGIILIILIFAVPIAFFYIVIKSITKKAKNKTSNRINNSKKDVIEPFLKTKFSSIYYDIENGFNINEYEKLGFFSTRGYVSESRYIIDDKYNIYDININYYIPDESTTHVFNGFLTKIQLSKNYNCKILIKNKKMIESLIHEQRNQDFITDNDDFDKYFSIKTDNIEVAKEVLNERVINTLLDILLENKYKTKYEIAILNNYLYISYEPYSTIDYNYLSYWKKAASDKNLENISKELKHLISITERLNSLIN